MNIIYWTLPQSCCTLLHVWWYIDTGSRPISLRQAVHVHWKMHPKEQILFLCKLYPVSLAAGTLLVKLLTFSVAYFDPQNTLAWQTHFSFTPYFLMHWKSWYLCYFKILSKLILQQSNDTGIMFTVTWFPKFPKQPAPCTKSPSLDGQIVWWS